ncbi:MAG TPA: malate synthase A [Acidimicrobiia bacterium]|nr:malate synthase A [Acidimicrobiia bacterium]
MSTVELLAPSAPLLTQEALGFISELEAEFGGRRRDLLEARKQRQSDLDRGIRPDFLPQTASVRSAEWKVDPVPPALWERKVEITGPVDQKMMINALNSGASVFMADFEDATSPTWRNVVEGQENLVAAYERRLQLTTPEKSYRLNDEIATLVVRPRGWHLSEKHLLIGGEPVSASLFDFGLYLFWGGRAALEAGLGPFLYLPKIESHLEARLWNDVFIYGQERLGMPVGTVKATVLIETILAAFEMDEILFELKQHSAGLNAGRWDYIFSVIKKMRHWENFVFPDRSQVTMTVPFMRAYTDLQVATCHRRGAHAIGGMAAFIPSRRDPEVTELALAKVTEDKNREAVQGCDGTWVAHPDLVPVARACFDRVLGNRPNQIDRQIDPTTAAVSAADLLDFEIDGGISEDGVRSNIKVGLLYLASWLEGTGAVAIDNLMEDVATAEIARSQIWQWVRRRAHTADGALIDRDLVNRLADEERERSESDLADAWKVFSEVALGDEFVEFLTIPAYQFLD